MNKCIICGDPTPTPIREALRHFRLVDWGQWRYWSGNISTFGFLSGLRGSICLSFPIINTLWNWKYRKRRLILPKGSDVDRFEE
jgi:hypothetical protein